MLKTIYTIIIFVFFSPSIVMAGTVIEIKDENGITTILTDGKQARLNTGGLDYVIINYKNNTVKAVDTKKRQVMLFDMDNMPKMGSAPKIQTSIKNLGAGSSIAGYKTQKFSYTVNGKNCGVIFASKQAYQNQDIKALFDAMRNMMQKQQAMLGGFAGMVDDCTLGDIEMGNHTMKIGVPMRTEKNGMVDFEVKSIKLDVTLPADTFVIPASYKTTSIKEEMQNASKDMMKMQQQMQQYQPQMQQMMQQMQQSGQMSPEVMERMRQAQEQMKRYQQPGY
ncbi:hypothetical protein JYT79_03225 [Cardiobacterium sp. AH-315-I02]|nr:hypothetical protein [Cardiobacterium sp. AH-315-I02]